MWGRRPLSRFLASAWLCCLAMASGCEPPPAYCDLALLEPAWDVEGLPPPGAAPEWVVTREIPFEATEEDDYRIHTWLPWGMNQREAYYVRGDDPVYLRMRFMGRRSEHRTITVTFRVFVDTRLVPIRHEGELVTELRVDLVDGIAERYIEIPSDQLPEGLSRVHLYSQYDQGEPRPYFFPEGDESLSSLTVMKNSEQLTTSFVDSGGYTEGEVQEGFSESLEYFSEERGEYRSFPLPSLAHHPNPGRPVRLRLRTQALMIFYSGCEGVGADLEETSAYIAVLDGRQVPIAGQEALIATLRQDEARVFEFDVDLPDDGLPHRFEILRLSGLGRPVFMRGGERWSPWAELPWAVGIMMWGDERYCDPNPDDPDAPEDWCFGMTRG